MKIPVRTSFRAVAAAALMLTGCGLFEDKPFEPTGREWKPEGDISVLSVTGSDSFPVRGWTAVEVTMISQAGIQAGLPEGLFFFSRDENTQDVVTLVQHPFELPPGLEVTCMVDCFCIDLDTDLPDGDAVYDVGPITDDRRLDRVISLLSGKEFQRPEAVDSLQHLVWEITEYDRLPQAYLDWLESLPDGGG